MFIKNTITELNIKLKIHNPNRKEERKNRLNLHIKL